ncbi:hypothetical protein EJ05DRAFT_539162 [Pseudovirgaria hyperparasitica]|uniref:Pre-rRNA-processing protein PNO1 n=1 Tax=Pseudovirgaria hyperparasitica TaxID=470096 RepID=A0A6A6W4W8_9PEZI|nr:uncharacterized protein EJ05DRAFT_539162 [Pseudovirgaria hyperparasitica]KAF2757084.1 hypothetical protein EJ05DRAFT_539162 [Pseudovirgaria hyperparasitica]
MHGHIQPKQLYCGNPQLFFSPPPPPPKLILDLHPATTSARTHFLTDSLTHTNPQLPANADVSTGSQGSIYSVRNMPAPTALQRAPETLVPEAETQAQAQADQNAEMQTVDESSEPITLDPSALAPTTTLLPTPSTPSDTMEIDPESRPHFAPASTSTTSPSTQSRDTRKVRIPPHSMTPLKKQWADKVTPPLVEHLKLQVRMNLREKAVELRTSKDTTDAGALQKGEDFVRALSLGFDADDAIALLRLDDLYIETFEIKDVKTLQGDHLSRAIGRIAGKDGKTKFAIENASKTRVVLADSKIHILGGFKNIHVARTAIVSLIMGAPPGKVYGNLRTVSSRMKERF